MAILTVQDLPVGTRVFFKKSDIHDPSSTGTVVGLSIKNPTTCVVVEFDTGAAGTVPAASLKLDNPADNTIELQDKVNAKLTKVINLIQEANILAVAEGITLGTKDETEEYIFHAQEVKDALLAAGIS